MSHDDEEPRDPLAELRSSIASFAAGTTDLDEIQSALQIAMTLLETDAADTARSVRLTEADVEEIRFTRLLAEQRPAVLGVVNDLLRALPEAPGPRAGR